MKKEILAILNEAIALNPTPSQLHRVSFCITRLDTACRLQGLNTFEVLKDFFQNQTTPPPIQRSGYTCKCGQNFGSTNALNGHKKGCKIK